MKKIPVGASGNLRRAIEWLGQDQPEPISQKFHALRDTINQTPAARFVSSQENESSHWGVQIELELNHSLVWHVIQRYSYTLNWLTTTNPLPTKFFPRSLPSENGPPEDLLHWRIECIDPLFLPDHAANELQRQLPENISNEEDWTQ
ncbi:hypothetical protein [Yoonia algicola]|uniref:Uncharacterized protein n=1 Tax=Yoonia algicola TaxID=3137368 RepID=A0AAN0NFV3_9RHOB